MKLKKGESEGIEKDWGWLKMLEGKVKVREGWVEEGRWD